MYLRFVEINIKFNCRFITLANERQKLVMGTHHQMMEMMKQLEDANALASGLKRDLERERIVLEERKAVNNSTIM